MATTKANELGQIIDSIVPSSLGTAGQVLTVNSGATAATFADAGGGADLYSANESSPNAQPSATGSNAIAVGDSATASGSYGLALGAYSSASGSSTFSAQGGTASALSSTAIGSQSVASGTSSVALGYNADATGDFSAALGRDAQAITASRAVAIGKSRASGDTSFAAAVGNNSSYGASGANSIAIGQLSQATQANSIAIGDTATSTTANQIALGGATDTVKISNTYTLPTADGTNGQVMTTNGSGVVSFADAGGGADLYAAETTGSSAPSASGTRSLAIGSGASSAGTEGVAVGVNANAYGNSSVAIGDGTVAGTYSVAIGWDAADTGPNNVLIGRISSSNYRQMQTIIGMWADGGDYQSGNTAVGYGAKAMASYSIALTNSYASGASSFAAAVGNNTSSYGASGANSVAMGYLAKATAGNAVAIGSRATASASASMSFCTSYANYGNVSSAANAITMGDGNSASATSSIATGYAANANVQGKHAHANGSFGGGNAEGSAQRGTFVLRCDTTDATAEALRTSSGTASTDNQVVLPNDSCYGFTGTVIAREDSSATNDFAIWEIKGGAVRGASASTTALGTYNINKISESTGATNWSIALSADTTNGAVAITVTGEASHNIRWVATVNTTEVTY